MRRNTHLLRISALLMLGLSSAGLQAVEAGLPFTEDFVDTDSRDSALTNANWSTEEQALFLAWRSAASAGAVNNELDVGTETDDTHSIVLGDLNNDGYLDVVAGNNGVASMVYFNDGSSAPFLGEQKQTLDVNATRSIVLGDVNGDGALDIVMGNYTQVNRLYLNNGSGVFPAIGSAIGVEIDDTTSVSLGDVDGDGDLDLVAGSYNATQANKLYLNNGDGVFTSSGTPIGAIGNVTTDTILLDADGDGDLDLAIANYSTGVANKLYKNDGAGDFSANVSTISTETKLTNSLVAGDVDGDGDIDFISGNSGEANRLHLNINFTNKFFNTDIGADADAAGVTTSVALADSDNDGDIDLIVGNYSGKTKRYINDGDGQFSSGGEVISSSEFMTYSVALGDVDGDGDIDIITGESAVANKLYLNSVEGGGYAAIGNAIGAEIDNTMAIVIGDVDGDSYPDLIAGNAGQTNKLYLNDGEGGFPEVGVDVGSTTDITYSLVLGDVNVDGFLDLVVGNWGTPNRLYLNDGAGVFDGDGVGIGDATDLLDGLENDATTSIALSDIDNDNDLDVVVGNWGQVNKYYENAGGGVYSAAGVSIGIETDNTRSIALVDVDSDNGPDVVVGNRDQVNKFYLNNGAGVFPETGVDIGSEEDATLSIAHGDVGSGNGPDLIFGNSGETNKLYLNTGVAGFFPATGTPLGLETDVTTSVLLIDADGDDYLDLLAGNDGSPNMRYLNNGTGVFSTIGTPLDPGSVAATRALVVADLDGLIDDNNTDVDLVAAEYGVTNKVYKNELYQTHLGRVVSGKINTTETNFRGLFLSATAKFNSPTTSNTRIDYYLSNNGGAKWYRVSSDKLFVIPEAGSDLRWRAELHSLSPVRTPVLSEIKVDINVPPVIEGGDTRNVSVVGGETAVTTVVATDEDGAVLVFGIVGGDDKEKFSLDRDSGGLTFIEAPDFAEPTDSNGDNVYQVRVRVEDSGAGRLIDNQDIFVTVTNPPVPWVDGGGANSVGWLSSLLLLLLLRRRRRVSIHGY